MAGPQESRVASHVHMQEVSRTRPLVSIGSLSRLHRATRYASPRKHLPYRRMRLVDLASNQPRPPPSPLPHRADPLLLSSRQQAGTAMRPTRTVTQAGERVSLTLARLPPPHPPTMRRRRRHPKTRRRLPQRRPRLHSTHQRPPTGGSEPRITVHIHPSLPAVSWQTQPNGRLG